MSVHQWEPISRSYDPLKAGSIDGTDTVPHDHGVVRAMDAVYKPNKMVSGNPNATIFIGRLDQNTSESTLKELFSQCGEIRNLRLIRDIVTGFSKGYAFVEYRNKYDACIAQRDFNKTLIDKKEVLVVGENERLLPGWIPRRLGGGLGGKKESGQLRFGGKDRPFRKPILPHRKNFHDIENKIESTDRNIRRDDHDKPYKRDDHHKYSRRDDYDRYSTRDDYDKHSTKDDYDRHSSRKNYVRHSTSDDYDRHSTRDDYDRHSTRDDSDRHSTRDDSDRHSARDDYDRHSRRHDYDRRSKRDNNDRHFRRKDSDRYSKRDDNDHGESHLDDKCSKRDDDDYNEPHLDDSKTEEKHSNGSELEGKEPINQS